MPLAPQITITPITVTSSNMTVTSVIGGGTPATTEQLTTVATDTATALSTANTALANAATAQSTANTAITNASTAQSTANTALSNAAAAQASANTAYSTAVTANTNASTAQSTADGKNTVTYSSTSPGSTSNKAGDVWYEYAKTATITNASGNGSIVTYTASNNYMAGTVLTISGISPSQYNNSSAVVVSASSTSFTVASTATGGYSGGGTAQAKNIATILRQYVGNGGSSWTQVALSGMTIANLDAGNITAGTITAAVGISNPSGNFSVDGVTGRLVCTNAVVTGEVIATTGTFTGTVYANSGTFTGTVVATTGTFTGTVYANNGTFTGEVIATTGSFTGAVYATTGTFTGTVYASNGSFTGNVNSATISGGTITIGSGSSIFKADTNGIYLGSSTFGSAPFRVTPAGALTSTSGTIGGFTIDNNLGLNSGTTSIFTSGGSSISASGSITTSGAVSGDYLVSTGTTGVSSLAGGLSIGKSLFGSTSIYSSPALTGRTLLIAPSTDSYQIGTSSSSRTVKQDIAPAEFDPSALLDLPLQQFRYIKDVEEHGAAAQLQNGLMAEDVADAGLEWLIDRDEEGAPNYIYWSERMPQALLKLVQDQAKKIDSLEARIAALETA